MLMLLAGEQVIYCCSWHGGIPKAMSLDLAVFSWVLGTTEIPVSPEGTDPPSPTSALTRVGEMIKSSLITGQPTRQMPLTFKE